MNQKHLVEPYHEYWRLIQLGHVISTIGKVTSTFEIRIIDIAGDVMFQNFIKIHMKTKF